ncbi:hypothetical protein KEM56_002625 [Ascosphaera pollenicola]|nr:hypothetical protein KEM56_002625 [Ascosphaera pollenicola]
MPITVYPVKDLSVNAVETSRGLLSSPKDSVQSLPAREIQSTAGQIFQSSFIENAQSKAAGQGDCLTDLSQTPVLSSVRGNGLVDTVLEAYNTHHHLILRPDDIWTAILSGFSFYVNMHSEELRSSFVAHEGRKQLKIHCGGTRHTVDFGNLAQQFTGLMHDNLIDKTLQEWILPNFSTTTDNDRVVASVLMMATLKNYFEFGIFLLCGLPAVTLLGEREDWVQLHGKLEKLKEFGEETATWASLLDPPIHSSVGTQPLVLDGVEYPIITIKDIPTAFATVPVHLNDNGDEFDTEMVSGSVAMKLSSSAALKAQNAGDLTAIQPLSGWAMYEKVENKS